MIHVGAPVASQQSRILRVDGDKVTPAKNRGNKTSDGRSDPSATGRVGVETECVVKADEKPDSDYDLGTCKRPSVRMELALVEQLNRPADLRLPSPLRGSSE